MTTSHDTDPSDGLIHNVARHDVIVSHVPAPKVDEAARLEAIRQSPEYRAEMARLDVRASAATANAMQLAAAKAVQIEIPEDIADRPDAFAASWAAFDRRRGRSDSATVDATAGFSVAEVSDGVYGNQTIKTADENAPDLSNDLFRDSWSSTQHERGAK